MKRFIIISLALVIVYLLLQNTGVYKQIIKVVTDLFGQSFRAVTSADKFK